MLGSFVANARAWAEDVFGSSTLPDERLMDRLIEYAAAQAEDPQGSTARVSGGSKAARDGAYRFLENSRVRAEDIDEGPFQMTAELCKGRARLFAVQDTTDVGVASNELREQLISPGSPTGFLVHSTLMLDGSTGEVIGLIDQQRWTRIPKGQEPSKNGGGYGTTGESAKWAFGDMAMSGRMYDTSVVINLSDREADIYGLTAYYIDIGRRFVTRAKHNRQTAKEIGHIFDLVRASPVVGQRVVRVEQRGAVPKKIPDPGRSGRARRDVLTNLQAMSVVVAPPVGKESAALKPAHLNVVRVSEASPDAGDEALEWILLTTESIATLEDVRQIVFAYEKRWVIEEFHKCWKTGCRLEERPFQSLDAVERMMSITAPIAVRILQLHTAARSHEVDKSADAALSNNECRCLWAMTEEKPFPDTLPSARWALLAIARLGGWYDTKKTGRVGWATLWHGWNKFQERLVGWRAALEAIAGEKM